MDMFSTKIKTMFKEERKVSMDRLKIAILDTGIDHEHKFIDGIKNRLPRVLMECCSFVGPSEDAESEARTQDTDGHGTHIAGLVMKLAPCAKIYIARISETRKVPLRNRIADVGTPVKYEV
jgi:subtilisin family serine protease